jgi:hypothetical protein
MLRRSSIFLTTLNPTCTRYDKNIVLKSTDEKYPTTLSSQPHHYTTHTVAPANVATRASTNVLAELLPDAAPATSPFHPLLVLFPFPVELGLFPFSLPAPVALDPFPFPLLLADPDGVCASIGNVSAIVGCIGQSSQTNILVVNPGGVVFVTYSPE